MQHPDEGTIHAWLDGALSADEARALEAHVAACTQCGAAVTEARGLLAASSRILSALDAVPGGVLPAAEPDATSDDAVIPIGRPSRWRSPGWRAAAAIVLVGSVSWLATRSAPRAESRNAASQVEYSGARADDSGAAVKTPPAMAETVSQVSPQAAKSARPARPSLEVAAGRSEAPAVAGTLGNADKPMSPPPAAKVTASQASPPQIAAAPRAMPYAMPRLAAAPDVGAVGGGAAAETKGAVAAAPASANETLQRESRVADAGLSVRGAATGQARMKSSAASGASGAPSLMQAPLVPEAAVERLAGCYYIETAASHSTTPGISAAAGLVPAQVELLPDLDPSAGGKWRILRPAPGSEPFRLAAHATWLMLTADSVRLELREGLESVSARLRVTGDSIHGYANVSVPQLPAGGMGTGMRGSRMLCSSP